MEIDETILEQAQRIIYGERNKDYGHPIINHLRTAAFWCIWKGTYFTPIDVCMMNIFQKQSRSMNKLTFDNLVDIAGYTGNIERIVFEDYDFTEEELDYIDKLMKVIEVFREVPYES